MQSFFSPPSAGLFPAVSASHSRLRCNFGARPFRFRPPPWPPWPPWSPHAASAAAAAGGSNWSRAVPLPRAGFPRQPSVWAAGTPPRPPPPGSSGWSAPAPPPPSGSAAPSVRPPLNELSPPAPSFSPPYPPQHQHQHQLHAAGGLPPQPPQRSWSLPKRNAGGVGWGGQAGLSLLSDIHHQHHELVRGPGWWGVGLVLCIQFIRNLHN